MNKKFNILKFGLFSFFLLCFCTIGLAQKGIITGIVSDADGALIGANVVIKGTTVGTTTDFDGKYSLSVDPGTYDLEVSYIGYGNKSSSVTVTAGATTTIDFKMSEGVLVDEVIVIGTRASNRTNTDSPVPVDVINIEKLAIAAPQTNLNQLLHTTTPSFNSNTQTISDGTDHIDPASLRGLGPDQTLVLINGKRRHTTSLVNVNGTFGRGSVGTDLNAIPTTALKGVEVLRDGAAAQYGSDAIAGVINARLRENVNELHINFTTGANFTSEIGPFLGEKKSIDGEVVNLGINYGLPIGNDGGFINLTGEFNSRGATNRMLEYTDGVFALYNGIERVASGAGADISALSLADVQQYAPSVGYITSDQINAINAASDLSDISGILASDVTSSELAARGQTITDYNMRVGQSDLRGGQFFANMGLPLGEDLELYSFGGIGYRTGESGCFFRLPGQDRTTTAIWPNGTVPRINSNIIDKSAAVGIRGKIKNWTLDLSNTYGKNEFLYRMTETHNATLGASSPTDFNVGGHNFIQNTANLDLSQYFDELGSLKGLNVAFGSEYRYENYNVIPGSEASYGNFDVNGNLVNPTTPDNLLTTDITGRGRPAGSQCFAGFLPSNVVDARRSSVAGYLDLELDVSDAFLIGAAIRGEDYSDFGSTFNYKFTSRYKVTNNLAIRGAVSTGFRAPSLHQINFNKTSTIFELINGVSVPTERGTFSNTSRAAQLLGIPQLTEETSMNFSLGFTAKIPTANIKITVDAFKIDIADRIVYTGDFSAGSDAELQTIFDQAGANSASFFSNAIDTETQGIDVVISHSAIIGDGSLRTDLAGTFSKTTWNQDKGINASELLERKGLVNTYFDQTSRIYLEKAVPNTKLTLSHSFTMGNFSAYLRNTFFGETTEATNEDIFDKDLNVVSDAEIASRFLANNPGESQAAADTYAQSVNDPINSAKVLTDLSVAYQFTPDLSVTIGANNLFDVYPDLVDDAYKSSGRFIYSRRSPQFSFGGRYLFTRIVFTLK